MEDTHIVTPKLTKDQSLFAVFDGHGGSHVSEYAKDRFSDSFDQLDKLLNTCATNQRPIVIKEFLRRRFMDLD